MKITSFSLLSILVLYHLIWNISADGESDWREAIAPSAKSCKHHMSDETAVLFEVDEDYDNEEVRNFLACFYEAVGYMKDNKIDTEVINEDIKKYFQQEQETAKSMIEVVYFCKTHEVDKNDSRVDVAGKFTKCLNSKKKIDV